MVRQRLPGLAQSEGSLTVGQILAKWAPFGLSEPLRAAVVRPRLALGLAEPR